MIKRGEFQGKAVISLMRTENDKFPFSFGVNKAKLILSNLEEIQKFVEECDPSVGLGEGLAKKDDVSENPPF